VLIPERSYVGVRILKKSSTNDRKTIVSFNDCDRGSIQSISAAALEVAAQAAESPVRFSKASTPTFAEYFRRALLVFLTAL
jgi:hypothetical protein